MIINGYKDINVTYDKNSSLQCFAVSEFETYLEKIFPEKESDISLILNLCQSEDILFDGFTIDISDNSICINATIERGLLYGVYAVLEKIGCRFTMPITQREIIPQMNSVEIENGVIKENPCMEHRGICFYSTYEKTKDLTLEMYDWMTKNRFNFLMTALDRPDDTVDEYHTIKWLDLEDTMLIEIKKRGIILDMSEHSTDYFFSRELIFKENPEWFAMIEGKRQPAQMCYANQDAVNYYGDQYIKYVEKHPEIDMIGIWPLDGGGYCECERCTKDPLTFAKAIDTVARRIKEINPHLVIEQLAYTKESFTIPNFEECDNIAPLCCSRQDGTAYAWGQYGKNRAGAYYFEYNNADNYRASANVMINPSYNVEVVNMFVNYGYKGIVSLFLPIQSFFIPAINYYYMRKAYWEINYDKDIATQELCTTLYGEHNSSIMNKVHKLLTEKLQDPALWSRFPFRSNKNWFSNHATRNKCIDEKRHSVFIGIFTEIIELMDSVNKDNMNKNEIINFDSILLYIHYQKNYYESIDLYDYSVPENYDIDGFFKYVENSSANPKHGFIPVAYAKWRIIGRDNILVQSEVKNDFIAD